MLILWMGMERGLKMKLVNIIAFSMSLYRLVIKYCSSMWFQLISFIVLSVCNMIGFFFIQSLWHLRRFRDEFLRRPSSEHIHVGDPCVVCSLYDIFMALSTSSMDNRRDAIAPTSLRVALSNLYPDSNFFQEVSGNMLIWPFDYAEHIFDM